MHTPNKEESIFPIGNQRHAQDTQLLFQHPSHIPPIELPVHRLMHANYEHIGYQGRKITACPGTYTGSSEKGRMESEGKAGHDLHCTANFSKPRSPNPLSPLAKQSICTHLAGKVYSLYGELLQKYIIMAVTFRVCRSSCPRYQTCKHSRATHKSHSTAVSRH